MTPFASDERRPTNKRGPLTLPSPLGRGRPLGRRSRKISLVLCAVFAFAWWPTAGRAQEPKQIVVIAGIKSHGPEGNRMHDYPWSAKLVKVMFDNSNVRDKVQVKFYRDGWPSD